MHGNGGRRTGTMWENWKSIKRLWRSGWLSEYKNHLIKRYINKSLEK